MSRALQNGFRIGEAYHVEPSLNRVTSPLGINRLEPKVMLVLVCLAERAGQMVPKYRLMHSAWADTAVTDDVLTRAELQEVSAGRAEDAAEGYREILELNPSMVLAMFNLAGRHASLGEWDRALPLCEEAYALASLPRVIGLLAGVLQRTGDTHRAEEMLRRLQPADAFGVPLGLALYHWVLQEIDAEADWFEKAIDQRDPISPMLLRFWYAAELRATPRWGRLMRKLNLPESG